MSSQKSNWDAETITNGVINTNSNKRALMLMFFTSTNIQIPQKEIPKTEYLTKDNKIFFLNRDTDVFLIFYNNQH